MNLKFVDDCINLPIGKSINLDQLTYNELFNLKYPEGFMDKIELMDIFYMLKITAHIKKDVKMLVWNQLKPEFTTHICPANSQVLVWMVSRLGDVGITDNLNNPIGYDARIDCNDLYNWKIISIV